MRRRPALLSALVATALIAVALAGCASSGRGPGDQPAGCTPSLPTGDASSTVTATGAIGKQPKVSFPTPLVTRTAQATVLTAGHGTPAAPGGQIDFDYSIYNGRTGTSIGGTGYTGQLARTAAGAKVTLQASDGSTSESTSSIAKALVCAQAGSRIAVASTAEQLGFGSLASVGIGGSGTVVVIIDVADAYPGKADGANQLPQDGMPDVVTAVDGQPGIVVQELAKPSAVRSEVVKAGGGAVVRKSATAVLNYTAWSWPDDGGKPAVITSLDTWTTHQARDVKLSALSANGVLPTAVTKALAGQRVGSQVLVVVPPKDGYTSSTAPSDVTGTQTLIFVVDILGVGR